MKVSAQTVKDFIEYAQTYVPGFEIRFKDQSKLMKVLGFLMNPFAPGFMTHSTTTIGNKVYFPNQEYFNANPLQSLEIAAHESVHGWDGIQHPVTFKLSYLFPQILAVLPILVFLVMAWPFSWVLLLPLAAYVLSALVSKYSMIGFWITLGVSMALSTIFVVLLAKWAGFALLAALVCFLPFPAPWRTKWEVRGYAMSMAVIQWTLGAVPKQMFDNIVNGLIGPGYFFMSWSRTSATNQLAAMTLLIENGALAEQPPYRMVSQFLRGNATVPSV